MYKRWIRFLDGGEPGFGLLEGDQIRVHHGDMFGSPRPSGQTLSLGAVAIRRPVEPGKVIALWNNFAQLSTKLNLTKPLEPLYLLKSPNSFNDPGAVIPRPRAEGKVVFEGELGVVIGKTAAAVSVDDAMSHVFGLTCVNDVTHADILFRDPTFAQWVRSKGFDGFLPIGPVIATDLHPEDLVVKTLLNAEVRQSFPISDMHFSVAELVSLISNDMTLYPGDLIICGTSVGVGSMKPGSSIEIHIEGIGTLSNTFE